MNSYKKMRRVLLKEKLCFVCGLSKKKAQAITEGYGRVDPSEVVDLEEISARTGLDLPNVKKILSDPKEAEYIRLDPNRVTEAQLKKIPQFKPSRLKRVVDGRPYYSFEELQAATALPRSVLEDLFEIRPLGFQDKIADKEVTFVPVPGRYIVPQRSELEAEDPVETAGYVEVFPASEDFGFRVVAPKSFEEEQAPYNLKAAYAGNVHPVLRDSDGFERYFAPHSLDLWFKLETPEDRRLAVVEELGLQLTYADPQVGYYRAKLASVPDDRDVTRRVLELIDEAQQLGEMAFAEPDQVGFEDFGPDVSDDVEEDDFEAADRFWHQIMIDLADAHATTQGSHDVTVFIIDSGCRTDHEELTPVLRGDWSNLDLNYDLGVPESIMTPHEEAISHGTNVAGIVQQVAPGCRILPVKISGRPTTPAYGLRAAAIRRALTYLEPNKRAVINISWRTNGEHIGIREALVEAQNKGGVAIVASAGNYSFGASQRPDEKHYPSGHMWFYPELTALCSVASVVVGDRRAHYSYYGENSVTVAAPGGERGGAGTAIYTTSTPEKHKYTAGTSFAAPHVAGLIALLFSKKSELSAEQAIQLIRNTADPIGPLNPTAPLGKRVVNGVKTVSLRINARAALEAAVGVLPGAHTITATAGEGGTIIPAGIVTVDHGADRTFTITADPGNRIKDVRVDGSAIEAVADYTFHNVSSHHTIDARFEQMPNGAEERLNINQATAEQLAALPFLGPWLAEHIVMYRENYGPFASIWALSLSGVSPWVVGQLAPLITV